MAKAKHERSGLDNCLISCGQPEKSARIEACSISAAFLHAFSATLPKLSVSVPTLAPRRRGTLGERHRAVAALRA